MKKCSMLSRSCGIALVVLLGTTTAHPLDGDQSEAGRVEGLVRAFFGASQVFDEVKVNSFLAPGARWIEDDYPSAANVESQWRQRARVAGVQISYNLRDFVTEIRGDVAWVTVTNDGTFLAKTPAARQLMWGKSQPDQTEWHDVFVETLVLVRSGSSWRIVLGHTTDFACRCE